MTYNPNDKYTVTSGAWDYCEFPKANSSELKLQRVPAPLANVSIVRNYSKDEKKMIAEIAAEIGAEISDLYEAADNEETDYRDMRESVAMSRINELSDMAGNIADDSRARNKAAIAEFKDSPIYSVACDLIEFFGVKKNVLVRIKSTDYLELFNVVSDLGRGTDKCELVGRLAIAKMGYVFYPAIDGKLTMAVKFRTIGDFYEALTPDEILNYSGIFPNRVNVVKDRNMKFRNTPKGAKVTAKTDKTGTSAASNADKEIGEKEAKSRAALIAEAANFGYFPLPSYQGEWKITEEEKKTRASMKKRNQRAKAKAMEARDEKKIEIMEMIDAISKRNIAAKSSAKFTDSAIVPVKETKESAFNIVEYFKSFEKEKEALIEEAAEIRAAAVAAFEKKYADK